MPNAGELEALLTALYGADASLPAERFRGWAATFCPGLFAPLL